MAFSAFISEFPELDLPIPKDVAQTRAIRSDRGLVVFFEFFKDFELPMHSHLGQWGTVVAGEITLTIGGKTRSYGPGETYDIPAGVDHGGLIRAGTHAIDVFEEPDRYPLMG